MTERGAFEAVEVADGGNESVGDPLLQVNQENKLDRYGTFSRPIQPVGILRMCAISAITTGIEFAYAVSATYGVPIILSMGMPVRYISTMFLLSPITGMILNPVIGTFSDRSQSRFGRRRPILTICMTIVLFGFVLMSNAGDISDAWGGGTVLGVFLGMLGFWCLDAFLDLTLGPARALLFDLTSPSQENLANSVMSAMAGIGAALGYGLGALDVVNILGFFETNVRAVFTITILVLGICTVCTLSAAAETPYVHQKTDSNSIPLSSIVNTLLHMPRPLAKIVAIGIVSWLGKLIFLFFVTDWVGEVVYNGSSDEDSDAHDDYEKGVQVASLALGLAAVVNVLYSTRIPTLIRHANIDLVYFAGMFCVFGANLSFVWIRSVSAVVVIITITGIGYSTIAFGITTVMVVGGTCCLIGGTMALLLKPEITAETPKEMLSNLVP